MVGPQHSSGVHDTSVHGVPPHGGPANGIARDPVAGDTAPLRRIASAAGQRQGRLVKGVGLLAVAVVSGLVWWLIRHDTTGADQAAGTGQTAATTGEFQFSVVSPPVAASDCAANSYGDIQGWFRAHPCQSLSRALFITEAAGKRALVSVARVTMPAPEVAQQFKAITDTDNTGNVNDLVRDGTANIPGAPMVAKGEYESKVNGTSVTIVETNFFGGHEDARLLPRIAHDALRLGEQLG